MDRENQARVWGSGRLGASVGVSARAREQRVRPKRCKGRKMLGVRCEVYAV